jgi:hypothetical protein
LHHLAACAGGVHVRLAQVVQRSAQRVVRGGVQLDGVGGARGGRGGARDQSACVSTVSHEGLQEVRFAKTTDPHANGGRQLEQVGVPGTSCENRRALRLPVRAAKNWRHERTSRRYSAGESAACVAEVHRDANPDHAFF